LCLLDGIQYNPRVGELNILERIRQAAKDGDPFAQFELGLAFDWGHGVEQDFRKAAEFYAKAAKPRAVKAGSKTPREEIHPLTLGLSAQIRFISVHQRQGVGVFAVKHKRPHSFLNGAFFS
jgi:TPR repeat protein